MTSEEIHLKGSYIITPSFFKDSRGNFFESFNKGILEKLIGRRIEFVQDNQSTSKKGVLRGLHLQKGKHAQAKLVRVVSGKVLDVCVDLRKDSETFGQHFSIILDSKENKQLFIPKGFAHGFLTLSNSAILNYKCDNYYNQKAERGIIYNDPTLNIDWGLDDKSLILSSKDKKLPTFKALLNEKEA